MKRMADLITVVTGSVLLVFLALLLANVVARYVFQVSFMWIADLVQYLFVWIVYIGVAAVTLNESHLTMDAIHVRLPARVQLSVQRVSAVIGGLLAGFVAWLSWGEAMSIIHSGVTGPSGDFSMGDGALALPVGLAFTALAYAVVLAISRKEQR